MRLRLSLGFAAGFLRAGWSLQRQGTAPQGWLPGALSMAGMEISHDALGEALFCILWSDF